MISLDPISGGWQGRTMALMAAASALLAALPPSATAAAQAPPVPCIASAQRGVADLGAAGDLARRAGFVAAVDACMATMHHEMHAAFAAPSGGTDALFASAMIPHHQGAVDMARQLLLYGRDRELRSFALSVIAEQQAEIEMLRIWVARHPMAASIDGATTIGGAPVPVSARDRVYTADQVSNTVSVIDPSTDRLIGQIRLGNERLNILSPLYGGQTNVHGLGFSPDHRLLNVISTGSNAVTLIETGTNRVKGTVYVGRNPHEGFFRPDGRELWVTVRGENYVSVIDPVRMREVRRVVTANGPGMVVFRPDGKVAFVDHSFTPELDVVEVSSGKVLKRISVVSPFSPNLAITADGSQVWLTHKDVGKVTVVDAHTYEVQRVIDSGPVTNHVNFAGPGGGTRVGGASAGDFAYVTVCGENAVKVYRRTDQALVTTIPVGACPHGVWSSGDGTKVYIGLQEGDGVDVIDTRTNAKIAEIPMGQSPQALVYVPEAVPPGGTGTEHLVPLAISRRARAIDLVPPSGSGSARATVWVRSLGPIDGVDVNATGLMPSTTYTLFLRAGAEHTPPVAWPLATVITDPTGTATLVESFAPTTLPTDVAGTSPARPRLVLVRGTRPDDTAVVTERMP
jgi:YVTN family beta-propeller protein